MPSTYITPIEYAERIGIDPQKVRNWIESGLLRAVNISNGKVKPRWKISPEAITDFEESRSERTQKPTKSKQKRKRKQSKRFPKVEEFF